MSKPNFQSGASIPRELIFSELVAGVELVPMLLPEYRIGWVAAMRYLAQTIGAGEQLDEVINKHICEVDN